MKFSLLEKAVMLSSLEKYKAFCCDCLNNPENSHQLPFIEGELQIISILFDKIKQDYQSKGGDLNQLKS